MAIEKIIQLRRYWCNGFYGRRNMCFKVTGSILSSDAIIQPASPGCSSRVWDFPTSILQRKMVFVYTKTLLADADVVYTSALLSDAMKPLNMLSKIWKSFCNQNRLLSSSTWSGRLFSARKIFRICNRRKQGEPVPPRKFWTWFFTNPASKHLLSFAQTRYSAQNCAGYTFPLILNKQIFLEKNLFYENRRWFIQYCIKPELLLPVLKVKSGSITS